MGLNVSAEGTAVHRQNVSTRENDKKEKSVSFKEDNVYLNDHSASFLPSKNIVFKGRIHRRKDSDSATAGTAKHKSLTSLDSGFPKRTDFKLTTIDARETELTNAKYPVGQFRKYKLNNILNSITSEKSKRKLPKPYKSYATHEIHHKDSGMQQVAESSLEKKDTSKRKQALQKAYFIKSPFRNAEMKQTVSAVATDVRNTMPKRTTHSRVTSPKSVMADSYSSTIGQKQSHALPKPTPLAFRNSDGKLVPYEIGKAPTILVKDYSLEEIKRNKRPESFHGGIKQSDSNVITAAGNTDKDDASDTNQSVVLMHTNGNIITAVDKTDINNDLGSDPSVVSMHTNTEERQPVMTFSSNPSLVQENSGFGKSDTLISSRTMSEISHDTFTFDFHKNVQTLGRKGVRELENDVEDDTDVSVLQQKNIQSMQVSTEIHEVDNSKTDTPPLSGSATTPQERQLRRHLIPSDIVMEDIDRHARSAPPLIKENLPRLVMYLTSHARTALEKVRAFYIWISHNINYDVSGNFRNAELMPTDPASVLINRVTVCEGYCRLMEAFCREANIPVKTISGYIKPFSCEPGVDATQDTNNAHAWNAVFVENAWYLLDVTWGAGYCKAKEMQYVSEFNEAYFFTDPDVFVTDHFPAKIKGYEKCESGTEWQLLEQPLSKDEFCLVANFDKHGKNWGIVPLSHKNIIIENVEYEIDIVLRETHVSMSDCVAFLYSGTQQLDQFTYTNFQNNDEVNIHVCVPKIGEFSLQVFGRRQLDSRNTALQRIVKYFLKCSKAYKSPIPYPTHHTVYGAVRNYERYGVVETGAVNYVAEYGEIIVSVKLSRYVDILARLFYGDDCRDLKDQSFVDYAETFDKINIVLRLPFAGYYKLVLYGHYESTKVLKPFVTYLIKSKQPCNEDLFPTAHEHALKNKCCLIEPTTKSLPLATNICVCVKSPYLSKVKCNHIALEKSEATTFEGNIILREDESKLVVYGCCDDEQFHPLYSFTTTVSNNLE